jgi:hypothetical protein
MNLPTPELDHLVIAAPTLEAGVRWCEQVLGITPGPGGEHALMGTHNRLALLSSDAYPKAYLEIIAINPQAQPSKGPGQARWFGLDEPGLQQSLKRQGPRLLHWVARVADLPAALAQTQQAGYDLGQAVAASRQTAQGLLSWSIAIRPDGVLLLDGLLPTLISWGQQHPTDAMPPSGLRLKALHVSHPQASMLKDLWLQLGGDPSCLVDGPPGLCAILDTPRGEVRLQGLQNGLF